MIVHPARARAFAPTSFEKMTDRCPLVEVRCPQLGGSPVREPIRPTRCARGHLATRAVRGLGAAGHFKLRTGAKCYLLTISDGFSRYLLRCEALRPSDRLSASFPSAAGRAFFLGTCR